MATRNTHIKAINEINHKKRKQITNLDKQTNIEKYKSLCESIYDRSPPKKSKIIESDDWDDVIEQPTQISKPLDADKYVACVIGTSMVKHFNVKELFPDQNCFFKSISGGLVKAIMNVLEARESLLKHCKVFIITAGSNDMDSRNEAETGIADFLKLAQYLKAQYKDAKFIINKLVPRTKTKYSVITEFEKRRLQFNDFLENDLMFLGNLTVVDHREFENKDRLSSLLSDGVHLAPSSGVPLYVNEIKKFI